MTNKKVNIIIAVTLIFLLVGIPMLLFKYKKPPTQLSTIVTGLTEGRQEAFKRDLSSAFNQYSYVKKGNALLSNGNVEDAIKAYEVALSLAKSTGTKGNAYYHLANAYEKKMDYKKALEYAKLDSEYTSEWAKPPVVERMKYLECAIKGEYNQAVQYARNAVEEEKKRTKIKESIDEYINRLNDLIAAKDYILSLKKKD